MIIYTIFNIAILLISSSGLLLGRRLSSHTLTSAGRLVVVCFDPSPSDDFTSEDGGATAAVATMGDWFPVLVPGSDFAGGFFSSVRFRLCMAHARVKNKTKCKPNIIIYRDGTQQTKINTHTHGIYRRNRIYYTLLIFARRRR